MSSVSGADKETEKRLKEMEKHLREIYDRATSDVGKAWTEYMEKANAEVARLTEAYIKAKESGDQTAIREAGKALAGAKQERTIYNNHYQQLTKDLAENISHVNETAMAYINNQLPEIYSLNYNSVAKGVNKQLGGMVGGTSFDLVDQNTVKRLATRKENLLPLKEVNGKKDIRWNVAKINSEVTQGILQGEAMPKIAERLSNVLGMDKVSAIRNARTTVTSAQNKGRMDMMRHARSKGVIVQKGWSSALDDRTRESHIELDGEFVGEDEPFSNGLMYPGDPNGAPEEVYNCRCSLIYKVVGFGDPQEEEDDPWEGFEDEQTEEQTEQSQEDILHTKYAETREQAYQLLTEDIGFYEVSPSMRYIDDQTVIAQTNQLLDLNRKYHAIGNNYGGYIGGENSKQFVATTRGSFTNPNSQNLVFSFDSYAHGFDKVVKDVKKDILSGWSMPAIESKYGVYTVTHEYGHILQNVLMSQRVDIDAYNAAREKIGANMAKLKTLKKKTEDEVAKGIFSEIIGIAKENNPNFSLRDNISKYGRSNYQEAFAEVFANSQLGKPNELGNAMIVWLERMGY